MAFNASKGFQQRNERLEVSFGDSLELTVVNNDSEIHGFKVKNHPSGQVQINPGDSATVMLSFVQPGLFIYYDPLDSPNNSYMGLAGMIIVKDNNYKSFYWNIKEHMTAFSDDISNNVSVDWSTYDPGYFTVNSLSFPDINADASARISGKVGDTIYLYMANTGQSVHSIHFHGYHAEIISSSSHPNHKGRSKDTFPINKMSTLILRLVPDKPGEYPIHDHNLVAVSGGGIYPNGMFSTILIVP